ncbi:polymorphic toxin type 44 domain-containing protein [Polyangium sp. y55x31]|uniref:polymorphic toxin type 44 domain-containing protein n=1 Tax=Polyangium sp. y55x31 TaxID=3042688 RepID=UPI002482BFB3|nr:polymorphic toxin type 44 domain-containing protein [Polyangium sp. y55x31]MDI1476393.1 polymorphic toxin type 44 domain-containing protein [Polyangium sp. y55x31]
MSGKRTAKKAAAAKTTPTTQKEPIFRVRANGASIAINLQAPWRAPFIRYHITIPSTTICARFYFEPPTKPITKQRTFNRTSKPTQIKITLSPRGAVKLLKIEIWAEPYGYAALLDGRNGTSALGRLTFEQPALAYNKPTHLVCDVHVLASVVAFIVDEMNRNKKHPDVTACRRDLQEAARIEKEFEVTRRQMDKLVAEGHPWAAKAVAMGAVQPLTNAAALRDDAKRRFGKKVHTNAGFTGFLMDVYFIGGGEWDHKPIIEPTWGAKNRLGNSEQYYFYDLWSNIHYGYVGRAAGFSANVLHEGANWQQMADSGTKDENVDYASVQAGFDLYVEGKDVTVEEVLAILRLHPEWTYVNRWPK